MKNYHKSVHFLCFVCKLFFFSVMHSWQIFLAVCSIPSLISGLLAIALPETPRFLASNGNPEEALNVLKKVYAINTGCSPDTYPVKK